MASSQNRPARVASPARPLPAAAFVAAVTATTLAILGSISLYSVRLVMERDVANQLTAAVTGVARLADPAAFDAVPLAPGEAVAPRGDAEVARVLDAVVAAMPDAVVYEVSVVRGDSMAIVASHATPSDNDHSAPPSRLGQVVVVQPDVRQSWNARATAVVSRRGRSRLGDAIRVWAPVRRGDGTVAGGVGALTDPAHFLRVDADLRDAIIGGIAVILALSALAGIGRYRSERSRALSDAQLVAAKEAAEATARSRGEFLANMSHEIRTPLHGVLGMTEALLATPHTEADRRSLVVINRSASSLLGILNDILDYSKLEAGRVELVNAPFDPRALVDDVTDLFAVRAEEKGLDLAARESARTDAWPVGDAARIRQVLLNLVGNAVKFTEKGSVQVDLSTVSIGRKTVALRIAVQDTGIGISPEMQERVFEQFSQAEGSTSRRFGGTGLGLTISRQLVVLMGGTLSVSSVPGEGSEFVVSLQLPATSARTDGTSAPRPAAGGRLLVCTPLRATRTALTDLCVRDRLLVAGCDTVDEAKQLLQRGDDVLAIFAEAISDADGPHPLAGRGIPLILITTVHHPLNNSTLSTLGAVAQLRRPVRQDHFSSLMSDLAMGTLRVPVPEATDADGVATPARAVPAAPAAPPVTPAAAPTTDGKPPSTSATARVMVVDDVDLNLMVAKAMLASLGVTVRTAASGEEALTILSREPMDLVLMDCHMPGLDGYEVTRHVRASEGPNRDTPIVALSASAFAEDRERAIASGMNDFATKPIELGALRAVLDRWSAHAATPAENP